MRLIDLSLLIPDLVIDMRYTTAGNFMNQKLYDDSAPLLNIHAAAALERAADTLRKDGYRLVIWDAYRPPSVQQQMLKAHGADNYVLQDSNHPKGLAVDLTLADQKGNCLDMGTGFDEFGPQAHADAVITKEQQQNRGMLVRAMEAVGFRQWPYEWWHFDFHLM